MLSLGPGLFSPGPSYFVMSWQNDVYVTGANPPPGRTIPVDSGWGHSGSRSDAGIGINTYIAGGSVTLSGASAGSSSAAQPATGNLPANPSRRGFTIYNPGPDGAYVGLGFMPDTGSYTLFMVSGAYYEGPFQFVGPVYVSSTNAPVLFTEFT